MFFLSLSGQAAPTLYVGGALSKEWKQDGKLYKYGDISVELQCIKLCRECGISVERADETDGGIAISNITSPKVMIEQADQSGRIDPDDFDEQTIIDLFGKAGAQMLIIDAIIGKWETGMQVILAGLEIRIPESMWAWRRCMTLIMH